jgi:protein gp37
VSAPAAIGHTEVRWNPVTRCEHISDGCATCSALAEQPLRWRTPRLVYVASTGDGESPRVPRSAAARVWAAMALTARHTFLVTAGEPGSLAAWLADPGFVRAVAEQATDLMSSRPWQRWQLDLGGERVAGDSGLGGGWTTTPTRHGNLWSPPWPLPNVWAGTWIEHDDDSGRAETLRQLPAAVRFVRLDPLRGPVPSLDLAGIDWVIVSGGRGRACPPLDLAWVRDIRDRCAASGTALFFKRPGGRILQAGSRELDGRSWDQMPGLTGRTA